MSQKENNSSVFLGLAAFLLLVGLLFARVVFPEIIWIAIALVVLLIGVLGLWVRQNHRALRSRSAAYGLNSLVTVLLVFGLLSVVNFMAVRYPQKLDLTRNKIHTLSDQTVKLVKGLKQPVKATLYAKTAQKEQFRAILDNYKALNPKFEIEYIDPDREPTRVSAAGVKKYGTLVLNYSGRDSRIEEISEEKLTNSLIKLTKEKTPTLCTLIGHGEKSFASAEAEGYSSAKKGLANQSYEVKDLNLAQEQNKVPADCDAVAIVGPTKAFFEPEIKALSNYLNNGGRALIALDVNIKGTPFSPELLPLLNAWNVKPLNSLVVDPVSRAFNVDASMPIVGNFSKNNPITRDFGSNTPSFFPIARPLEIVQTTPGLLTDAIAKTTPQSFSINDFKALATGEIKVDPKLAKHGPFDVVISVEGKQKDSKATRNTRLVVFSSSLFATNNFSRYGINTDFFLNGVSWLMEDESMISIRAKEEGPGKIDLSYRTGSVIFLLTVVLIPLVIAATGLGIWIFRRRL